MTYHVVGCATCSSVWIAEDLDHQTTAECPVCFREHPADRLRVRFAHDDFDTANEIRSKILAEQADHLDRYDATDDYGVLADRAENPVLSDREYCAALGLTPEQAGLSDADTGIDADTSTDASEQSSQESSVETADPGTGPEIAVEIADAPQLADESRRAPDRERGVSRLLPGTPVTDHGHTYWQVTPRVTDLVDEARGDTDHDLRADLLPQAARLVRDLATDHAPALLDTGATASAPRGVFRTFVADVLEADVCDLPRDGTASDDRAVVAEAQAYLDALARYALLWADDDYRDRRGFRGDEEVRRVERTLDRAATSDGPLQAPVVDTLQHTLAPLFAERDVPEVLTFVLDGEQWQDAHTETVETALRCFATLGEGFDLRLKYSPSVGRVIDRAVRRVRARDGADPDWVDAIGTLTETTMRSRSSRGAGPAESEPTPWDAWDVLADHAQSRDLLQLLSQLREHETRAVGDLKRDDAVQAADGSLYPYLDTLEQCGLLDSEMRAEYRHVSLTPLGAEARTLVTDDGRLLAPDQANLSTNLTQPLHDSASKCNTHCDTRDRDRPDARAPADPSASAATPSASTAAESPSTTPETAPTVSSAESPSTTPDEWLADTGDPREEGFVQFLGDYTARRELQPSAMHNRLLAGQCVDADGRRIPGIHLVHHPYHDRWNQTENGDGRVAYLSGGESFDDTVLAVVQWGNPDQTLARLVASLLGSAAFGKILQSSRLGTHLEHLYESVADFEADLDDILRLGSQLGWTSDDELTHYDDWRDRLLNVRQMLVSKLADLHDLDAQSRQRLRNRLLGLFTTATHLYDAVGFDLVVNLQVPNVEMLRDDDMRYDQFLRFLRYVTTKQAVYEDDTGKHSVYRMQRESRPEKLQCRLGYDVDPDDPTADLTCSWVVSGDGAPDMQDDIRSALAQAQGAVRDPILDGDEQAAVLEIPVRNANSHTAIENLVRHWLARKEYPIAWRDTQFSTGNSRTDLRRIVRVFEAVLGTSEWGPSPFTVASALMALDSRDGSGDMLSVSDVAYGIGQLPASRFFPSLWEEPGERRKPGLQRMVKALLTADGSLSRQELVDVTSESTYYRVRSLLTAVDIVECVGDGQFTVTLEPWWSPASGRSGPCDAHDSAIRPAVAGLRPNLVAVLRGIAERVGGTWPPDGLAGPVTLSEVVDAVPAVGPFEHLVRAYFGTVECADAGPSVAVIGRRPAATESGQQALSASV